MKMKTRPNPDRYQHPHPLLESECGQGGNKQTGAAEEMAPEFLAKYFLNQDLETVKHFYFLSCNGKNELTLLF